MRVVLNVEHHVWHMFVALDVLHLIVVALRVMALQVMFLIACHSSCVPYLAAQFALL